MKNPFIGIGRDESYTPNKICGKRLLRGPPHQGSCAPITALSLGFLVRSPQTDFALAEYASRAAVDLPRVVAPVIRESWQ